MQDDHPWPMFTTIGRGSTRGNQGYKGFLGPPDNDGCCTLQLRVQFDSLAVKLAAQASDWYRILSNEVDVALKRSKTYWRKARRRQDYDARADQDHMELHEWLQQLKDRAISHIETLIQKGEIPGPPYNMPDHLDFPFMHKFIERHLAGVPHNPRLRNATADSPNSIALESPPPIQADTPQDLSSLDVHCDLGLPSDESSRPKTPERPSPSMESAETAKTIEDVKILAEKIRRSNRVLKDIRQRRELAKSAKQEYLARHLAAVESEQIIQGEEEVADEQRSKLISQLLAETTNLTRRSTPISATHSVPLSEVNNLMRAMTESAPTSSHTQFSFSDNWSGNSDFGDLGLGDIDDAFSGYGSRATIQADGSQQLAPPERWHQNISSAPHTAFPTGSKRPLDWRERLMQDFEAEGSVAHGRPRAKRAYTDSGLRSSFQSQSLDVSFASRQTTPATPTTPVSVQGMPWF